MSRQLLLLLAVLCVTGCSVFGDDDEPIDPPAELTEFDAAFKVSRVWEQRIGGGTELLMLALSPAVDGGRVYAGTFDGRAIAVDAETGRRVWAVDTDAELSAGPSVGEGLVVFGTTDGQIVALDALEGTGRWKATLSGEVLARPAVGNGLVIVRTVDGYLRALDAADGSEFWSVEQQVPRLSLRGNSAPAIVESAVIAGFDNGRIAAYDLDDGDIRWENVIAPPSGKTELERLADVDSSIVVVGQDVYVGSYNGRVASLAAESGQVLWSQDVPSYESLGVDWTALYASDQTGDVVALSRSSGAILWTQEALHMRQLTSPTPHENSVIVGDFEGYLHWLNALTGDLEARARVDSAAIVGQPVTAGDLLFVQTESGRLAAYRAKRPSGD
jgi:outer membrane protein assembly factor BamB